MRANEFLKEEVQTVDPQAFWSKFTQDCALFLQEMGGPANFFKLPLLRGSFDVANILNYAIVPCLPGRKPRNTPESLHRFADEWFESETGIPFRSHAFFCTGDADVAASYGNSHYGILVPIGKFDYVWSDIISDMTITFDRTPVEDDESEEDFVNAVLNEGNYTFNKGLVEAINSSCEIMVHCKNAYMLNRGFFYMLGNRFKEGKIQ